MDVSLKTSEKLLPKKCTSAESPHTRSSLVVRERRELIVKNSH